MIFKTHRKPQTPQATRATLEEIEEHNRYRETIGQRMLATPNRLTPLELAAVVGLVAVIVVRSYSWIH